MNKNLTRAALLDSARASGDCVPVVISTTEPVERDGLSEILSHDPAHVDLGRAPLPLLVSHDSGQLPVGVVEDLQLVGGKLRGTARFSDNPVAQNILADVRKGILRSVSVGYRIKEVIRRTADSILCAWEPFEVSCVSVPADRQAGFFRSHERNTTMKNENENIDQNNDQNSDSENLSRSQRRASNRDNSAEISRRDGIEVLAEQHGKWLERGDVAHAIREGYSVERFKTHIMARMQSGHTDTSERYRAEDREWDGMSKQYSLTRALQTVLDPAAGMRAGGAMEREMSDEIARRTGRKASAGGILIPDSVMYKRGITVGTASTGGGALHLENFSGDLFAESFRANSIIGALGARVMPGQTGDLVIPRQTANSTMGWVAEVGTAAESTLDFDQLILKPKRVSTFVVVSTQSLIQSGLALEALLRDDLMRGQMVEYDRVALSGAGTGSEPTGIVNTSGIGTVVGGTNGAIVTYGALVDLEAACANANATFGSSGYAVNPKTRAYLKKTAKVAAGVVPELAWNDAALDANGIGMACGHRAGVSTNLRSNLTKGTSTTVCSEGVFSSDWSELILARFGGNEIIVDPYSLATSGQLRITLNGFVDVGVRRAAAFAKVADLLTT